jgi:hypothetical protein
MLRRKSSRRCRNMRCIAAQSSRNASRFPLPEAERPPYRWFKLSLGY